MSIVGVSLHFSECQFSIFVCILRIASVVIQIDQFRLVRAQNACWPLRTDEIYKLLILFDFLQFYIGDYTTLNKHLHQFLL